MMLAVARTLRWVLSLGRKFARVVPLQTIVIVCLTLISQVSALLATFLPLKVVILLGSERIPRYFPDSWAALDRDLLIGGLCLGTIGFFALHLLAERLIRTITAWGTKRLLARSHKMALFESQDEVAQEAYQRFSRALAGGVFIALALGGLAFFYPAMVAVQATYLLLVWLVFWLVFNVSEAFQERLESKLVATLNLAAGTGFFISFGYLVVDFLFWTPPNVIVGIVALLLSRQVMQRTAGLIGDLYSLRRQQAKLDALFFHGKMLMPALPSEKSSLWTLIEPSRREEWVAPLLREFTAFENGALSSRWYQLTVPNVVALQVDCEHGRYLIKLFDGNRSAMAMHETTLLMEPLARLPALRLLGATQVKSFHCVVYEWLDGIRPEPAKVKGLMMELSARLMSVCPTTGLQQRFQRSRPMLWQRLRYPLLERLRLVVANEPEQLAVEKLLLNLPALTEQLKNLPVYIYTPDMRQNDMHVRGENDPVLISWGRWSLEPVGAGWPVARLNQLQALLDDARLHRAELKHIELKQAELAALGFALEAACQGQRYLDALELLQPLLERLNI